MVDNGNVQHHLVDIQRDCVGQRILQSLSLLRGQGWRREEQSPNESDASFHVEGHGPTPLWFLAAVRIPTLIDHSSEKRLQKKVGSPIHGHWKGEPKAYGTNLANRR